MVRRAARVDENHGAIREALRQVPGVTVVDLSRVGDGVPDLLVGHRGRTVLIEVKDGAKAPSARRLTPAQQQWVARWHGSQVHVVETVEQALICVGVLS